MTYARSLQPSAPNVTDKAYVAPPNPPRSWSVIELLRGLVRRGYLGASEIDDTRAVREALSLFFWDEIDRSRGPVH